ncbi:MAG: DNA alkylation repair protein, partial [Verrucomicrobia bacterium]|nr:DNA alkylation repair protein [Verrucomicrobiota bacterium]
MKTIDASRRLRLPSAPRSIQKGSTLKTLLDEDAIECLAHNIGVVHEAFRKRAFVGSAMKDLKPLSIMERGDHLARMLREHLPARYDQALD